MQTYKYFAFISYSRRDSRVAAWLQKRLEWFRFPIKLVPEDRRPPSSHYVRPIFRDRTNLEVSDQHYWTHIRKALEQSRFLIVLCSRHSAESGPVNMEVSYFLEAHGGNVGRVVPVVLGGRVSLDDSESALCPALRSLGEPLITRNLPNMAPDVDRDERAAWEDGFVSLISYLLRLERSVVGDHIQREAKRQAASLRRWLVAVGALAILAVGAGLVALGQRGVALANEQRAIALLSETLVSSAGGSLAQGLAARAREQLDACPPALRFAEWRRVSSLVPHPVARLEQEWWCQGVAAAAECRYVITRGRDDGVLRWTSEDQYRQPVILSADADPGFAVDALCSRVVTSAAPPAVVVHELASRKEVFRSDVDQAALALAISSDGAVVAWASEDAVRLASVSGGREILQHEPGFKPRDLSFGGGNGRWLMVRGEGRAALVTMSENAIGSGTQIETRAFAGSAWIAPDADRVVAQVGQGFSVQDLSGRQLRFIRLESAHSILSVSPQGDFATFSLGAGSIALVSLETGAVVLRHTTPGGRTNDAHAYSKTERLFAYDKGGGRIELVKLSDQKRLGGISTHESQINGLAFSPDGGSLLTGSDDGFAMIWKTADMQNDELIPIAEGTFDMQPGSIDLAADGGRVVLADYENRQVTVYDLAEKRFSKVACPGVMAVQAGSGGQGFWAACGPPNPGVFQYGGTGSDPVKVIEGTGFLCLSGDDRIAACLSRNGHPSFFDTTTGVTLREYPEFTNEPPHGVAMSPDGEHLVLNLDYADIRVLRRSQHSILKLSLPQTVRNQGMAFSMAVSQDSTMLAAGFAFGEMWLFRLDDGKVLHQMKASDFHVTGVCFADDDKRLISLGSSGNLQFWDVATGRVVLAETRSGVSDDTWAHFLRSDHPRRLLLTTDSGNLRLIRLP